MNIIINWRNLQKRIINWHEVEKVIRNGVQIRPESTPPTPTSWPLCFTANTSGCSIKVLSTMSTHANLRSSTDWVNWAGFRWRGSGSYWLSSTIILDNAWDKVYFRNADSITTLSNASGTHQFLMTWSISASGDVTYLLNPNGTTTIGYYAFYQLFKNCTSLTTSPELPATTLWEGCYEEMFSDCSSLISIPKLPATNIPNSAYRNMFLRCSNVKISETQTWDYQTPYRIPNSWTWSAWSNSLSSMFSWTWWTFTSTPTVNTTYYTSNTVI